MGKTIEGKAGRTWVPGENGGRTRWFYGEKAELARRAGTTRQNLSDIFRTRRSIRAELAYALVREAQEMGLDLELEELLDLKESMNPLFK
jgi:transcriptional regulator with XRE-family HTH domain